jgi:hypothetical protein
LKDKWSPYVDINTGTEYFQNGAKTECWSPWRACHHDDVWADINGISPFSWE